MQRRDASQVVSISPSGTHPRWLGAAGHVTGLKYASSYPGGPSTASWVLQQPPSFRDIAMDPGRTIRICRGAGYVWQGQLDEPSPGTDGWSMTAHGTGTYGTQYRDIWTNWSDPNDAVSEAISRGLAWRNPGFSTAGLWLGDQVDSAAQSITDLLTSITVQGSAGWSIDRRDSTLTVGPLPATPDRILVATSPVARSVQGDFNSLWLRYQATADNAATGAPASYALANVTNATDIARHGTWEDFYDLSSAGVLTLAAAQASGTSVLARYNRASFAGAFTVAPGQLLTMGGSPVDLGTERAGHVYRLVLTDYGYGGEVTAAPVTFIGGQVEYDDAAQTLQVTPFQSVASSFQDLLAAVFPTTSTAS